MKKTGTALVLPGAVTKGAFEAGALGVLAELNTHVDQIIASSAGSLNGAVYAAGLRAGTTQQHIKALIKSWQENGSWQNSLHLSWTELLSANGISDSQNLVELMRSVIKPCRTEVRHPIDLRIVVAPLAGCDGKIDGKSATTHEAILHFCGEDFDSEEGLAKIFQAAAAACAFPGLFAPVDLPGLGPCIDGSAVNNTPIRYALEDSAVERIIVPVPFPRIDGEDLSRGSLITAPHVLEAVVNERLYRDLKNAYSRNKKIRKIKAMYRRGDLSKPQMTEIIKILAWREIEIIEIRPPKALNGTLFSGFRSRELREEYISEGRKSAEAFAELL